MMVRFASQQFSVAGTALSVAEYNVFHILRYRFSLSATTTIYLAGNASSGAAGFVAGAWMFARRIR